MMGRKKVEVKKEGILNNTKLKYKTNQQDINFLI